MGNWNFTPGSDVAREIWVFYACAEPGDEHRTKARPGEGKHIRVCGLLDVVELKLPVGLKELEAAIWEAVGPERVAVANGLIGTWAGEVYGWLAGWEDVKVREEPGVAAGAKKRKKEPKKDKAS